MAADFVPTDAEITLTNAIFAQADPSELSVLTGDVAVRIFSGANVSLPILGEIWKIADEGKKGWLSKREVHIAVRLMGHAQAGTTVAKSLIGRRKFRVFGIYGHILMQAAGPLPSIEGIEATIPPNRTSGNVLTEFPPPPPVLNSQERAKFQSIFDAGEPINGLLSGKIPRSPRTGCVVMPEG
jgi:epidermal growth factor receptor substrate 15